MSFSAEPTNEIELAAFDPLNQRVPLPFHKTLYPIGFPLEIRTNDERVIASAMKSWSDSQQRFSTPPMQIRVAVSDGIETEIPPQPSFRAQGHLLSIISDAENFAVCDLETAFAFCWLAPRAARAGAWMRHFFLDAIAYCTLTHLYVTGVHAACIVKNGRGVLLSGRSGLGKSVLSLACGRAGWTFVTDDVAYVLRDSSSRTVIGKPGRMKFLPSAADLFPDADWGEFTVDQNGHSFVELETAQAGILSASECTVDHLVFLKRPVDGVPRFSAVPPEDAFARLLTELPVFADSVYESHRRSLRMLTTLQPVELAYNDLDDAVDLLNELVGGP